MVAVVNGSGLGLFTSNGSTGSAGLGQARERVYVNSTTGNLVIQGIDELLTANGSDLAITRTYNSLGLVDGDNDDGWRIGVLRSIAFTGSPTAPDRITKTFGDGARVVYTLNGSAYVSTEGDGAHDKFQFVSGQWVWTDGSARTTETYNTSGQLLNSKDADLNTFTYGYTNSLITSITIVSPAAIAGTPDQGGDGSTTVVSLDYTDPTGLKQLQRIRVTRNGVEQSLTSYTYDTGRLSTVTVDLTPENTADTSRYITTYLYEGSSKRVSSITQRAGGTSNVTATVGFTYEFLNNEYRLKTYTDGELHTTTFTYAQYTESGGTSTTVTANSGVLSTTENQNVTNNYALNPAAVSTTDTQTTTTTYNVNSAQITTGASQVDTYNRNNAALSTTDTQTTTTNYGVIAAQLTTNATQTNTYNRNNAALSTTDTQTTTTNYNVNSAQLTTNATQTNTYNRNNAVLSTTDTTTNNYTLNGGALTTPAGGGSWGSAVSLGSQNWSASSYSLVQGLGFDANGNGFAVTTSVNDQTQTADLRLLRYTRATDTWSEVAQLGSHFEMLYTPDPYSAQIAVDAAGNAFVAWQHPTEQGLFTRRFDVATGVWSATSQVPAGSDARLWSLAFNGTRAVVTTAAANSSLSIFRFNSGAWQAGPTNIGICYYGSSAAIDDQGNISIVFTSSVAGMSAADLYSIRYTAATTTWGAAELRESLTGIASGPKISFDTAGNGLAIWGQGSDLLSARYTRSTNSWSAATALDSLTGSVATTTLSVDAAGNAMVGWVQTVGAAQVAFVRRYNAATSAWSAATQLESTDFVGDFRVSINGNYAAATWTKYDGTDTSAFAKTFNGSSWSATTPLESTSTIQAASTLVAVDASGNATVTWGWYGNTSVNAARFTAGAGGGAPYYTVPAGATWQSVANTLYGINSAAAGTALQTALGNPALTTGAQLTGFPATLAVTTTVTVPAYYLVPAGATWQSIANAVYGINSAAAGTALQTAMSNPALSTGLHLTGLPATLSVTTTLAAHYLVPASATWQSIANTLYGVNSAAAGTALQTALGNPSIASGQRLFNIPATLSVTATTTVTVPAYYNVPAGADWQSIANAVYGINNAAAGSALQIAMGNPALSTGLHLTGFPATLSVTTTLAPHYLVPASATWQTIANALYGVNSAAAGTALQTALGNPSIASGQRLYNIPATLSVTTTGTVTVPAYYLVPAGATWQTVANAVYGINSAAAGTALQTALGNPALTTNAHLTGMPATLSVSTPLAAHYLVPAGATWQSVANTLYGVNSVAAGARLQTVLGNPALATGARLFSIPATLAVTTTSTITVPAYYVIPSGPGWQAIANTLYGINSVAAGSALQTALGNPTLTAGNRLTNLPATLAVTTTQTVTVAPYYNVPAGASWTTITQAVYNTSVPAAVAALQAVTGNPTLATGLHLTVPATLTYSTASTTVANVIPGALSYTDQQITPHNDPMTATLSTTQQVTTPTTFPVLTGQFQNTQLVPVNTDHSLITSQLLNTELVSRSFNLLGDQLTTPSPGWAAGQTMSGSFAAGAAQPQVTFDGAGNGLAVWVGLNNEIRWSRYSAAAKAWSAVQSQIIDNRTDSIYKTTLAMDNAGNAVLGWMQGTASSTSQAGIYASIYNPATNTWASPSQVGSTYRIGEMSVAIRNGSAAVGYSGAATNLNDSGAFQMYVARYNGTWGGGTLLSDFYTDSAGVFRSAIGIDSAGVINAVWTEGSITQGYTYSARYTTSWQPRQLVVGQGRGGIDVMGGFGASGDGTVIAGSNVYRYVKSTGLWTNQGQLVAGQGTDIVVDDAGNAVIGYINGSTFSVLTWNGSSWTAPSVLTTNSSTSNQGITVSIRNGKAVATWLEASGANFYQYVNANEGSGWGTAFQAGNSLATGRRGDVAIDSTGNMHLVWSRGTTTTGNYEMVTNKFLSTANAIPFLKLDSDPTWQEIAYRLYGENRPEAGAELQARMGNITLVPLAELTSFPASITYTANFPSAEPYYSIPGGATMQQVAGTLYGSGANTPEGGARLQALITAGTIVQNGSRLTQLPSIMTVTTMVSQSTAPYFLVTTSSWRSIANALYGIDSDAAGAVLQQAMGGGSPPPVNAHILQSALPVSILVNITTTQPTTPYYQVPSTASWRSVAFALYNVDSDAAGEALRLAMAALATPVTTLPLGGQLRGMPGTLSYNTTATITVPAYFLVPGGATWPSVTQTVYGTNDPAAATALQTAMPGASLAAGTHLTMPASISYTPTFGTSPAYQQTDVLDALGQTTTYKATIQGRLISTLSPTVGGARIETRYDYDVDGNMTAIAVDPTGLNRVTYMTYDAAGNLMSSRDRAGNTVGRTYDLTTNQLLSETAYLTPDPDGFGGLSPSAPLTTRFVYDIESHLRFVVSADGRVTEHRYFNVGTLRSSLTYTGATYSGSVYAESDLAAWALNRTPVERTDYAYDFRGNLLKSLRYLTTDAAQAGTGTPLVTSYLYDQRGNLLNVVEPRGDLTTGDLQDFKTSFVYDGLGRRTQKVEWLASNDSRLTTTVYQDASNSVVTTLTSTLQTLGSVTTTIYDRSGAVLSTANSNTSGTSFGTTTYAYDAENRLRMATDPTGIRSYVLYDALDRKSGEVDAEGRLTRFVYNRANQIVKAIRYSSLLSSTALATLLNPNGTPSSATVDSLVTTLASVPGRDASKDQISRSVYDVAGRLVYSIDPAGNVTQTIYDGASRVIEVVGLATPVTNIAASVDELTPSGVGASNNASDRRTRNFYDGDGHLAGTLDGAGFLVEYIYNAAGRLAQQIGYANVTNSANWLTGTLATLRPTLDNEIAIDPERDSVSYFYYDGQGRNVGIFNLADTLGYLIEFEYDVADQLVKKTAYQTSTSYDANLATVRGNATGPKNQVTQYTYDGAGRVKTETNFEGTVNRYDYNVLDEVTVADRAYGTADLRTIQARYDALGRVTQELSGEGSLRITGAMTQPEIEAVWTQWAVTHAYDTAGRRKSTTDAMGNKTWFFYDVDGRMRYAVRDLGNSTGEVTESRYNALGQVTDQIAYSGRISMSGIVGGLVSATITSAVNGIANTANDAHEYFTYKPNGLVETQSNQEGALSTFTYNAFGQLRTSSEKISASANRDHEYTYDTRGLLTLTRWDPAGINRTATNAYDAFGRLTSVTDQSSNKTRTEYDRLGRVITTYTALNERHRVEYDAFSRIYRSYDASDVFTEFTYTDSTRQSVLLTPEGVTLTTTHNRHGQTLTVIDSAGRGPTYGYDKDGQLTSVSDGGGVIETRTYDRAGRQETSANARGVVTRFGYDAASRILTRTEDFGGLALQTAYQYDGQGRVTKVTEPNGRVTDTTYYRDGRVKLITVDPTGLNERTFFEYDFAGGTIGVTQGYLSARARVTQYKYDKLGRRVEEIVDFGGGATNLNLTTQYRYDTNGNLTHRIEAAQRPLNEQRSTWYTYDANSRLLQTIDVLGGVTANAYDKEGRVVRVTRYANAVSVASFGDVIPVVAVTPDASLDRVERTAYDRDGRAVYTLDALGGVTQRTFDASGNVTRTRVLNRTLTIAGDPTAAAVSSALSTDATALSPTDRVQFTAYDLRGRAVLEVDGAGAVRRKTYDVANNIVAVTAYANPIATTGTMTESAINALITANATNDRVSLFWYDSLNRVRFSYDGEKYLTEKRYLDSSRQSVDIAYAKRGVNDTTGADLFTSGMTLAQLVTAAGAPFANSANDVTTTTLADMAGRISRVTDVTGNYEEFGYDALGNKTSYRNAKGSVWNYTYDGNGNLLDERSPSVTTYGVAETGGPLVAAASTSSVVMRFTYDAFGNVKTRTEGIRRFADNSENLLGSRTTTYFYDALGRQTAVNYPQVNVYAPQLDNVANLDAALMKRETLATPTTTTRYDTLGNAVLNIDVGGGYSRKAYDKLSRLIFEVDALGYATEYGYDFFGNKTLVTRYSLTLDTTSLSASSAWSEAQIRAAIRPSTANRQLTIQYDRRNLQTRVLQASSDVFTTLPNTVASTTIGTGAGETLYEYDAFGQVIRHKVLVNASTARYAVTEFFFDRKARQVAEVDALGYVTKKEYDSRGNVTRQVEFAQALSSGPPWVPANAAQSTFALTPNALNGYDREIRYVYDRLDRLSSEARYNVEYSSITNGVVTTTQNGIQTTAYGYDAVGNRTRVTDNNGSNTYTYYDVLGRVIGIAEPTRDVDGTATTVNLVPLAELRRDVYGNLVEEIRYANGANIATLTETSFAPAGGGTNQSNRFQYDTSGHLLRSQDAMGANKYLSYEIHGNIAKEWQPVTNADGVIEHIVKVHEYDLLGREVSVVAPLRRSDAQTIGAGGTVSQTAVLSGEGGSSAQWNGENVIRVFWDQTAPNVRVVVNYTKRSRNQADGGPGTQTANFSGSVIEGEIRWTELGNPTDGGILRIDSVTVYSVAANGTLTVIGSSTGGVTPLPVNYTQIVYTQTKFNAFGEVTARGVNTSAQGPGGTYQEFNEYDNVGHLWRSNFGDGITKIYLYDVAGRRTAEIRSKTSAVDGANDRNLVNYNPGTALALSSAEAMRTEAVFNDADQLVERRDPIYSIVDGATTTPNVRVIVKQKLDRWGNVTESTDAAGYTTRNRFDVLGGLVQATQPLVGVIDTRNSNTTLVNANPIQRNHFDILGRVIGTTDANGNVTSIALNAAGQALAERHADSGTKTFLYDGFGNQTRVTDELGWRTLLGYDNGNRLTSQQTEYQANTFLVRNFTFDEAGRRTGETSGETRDNGLPETTNYFYDAEGKIVKRRSAVGNYTWFDYDIHGHQTVQKDGIGNSLTWLNDDFGRVLTHRDLGNVITNYTYNRAGLAETTIGTNGINIDYVYDTAGHLVGINDTGVGRTTTFVLDSSARHVRERTDIAGTTFENTTIGYDALGRISTLVGIRYSVTYRYDAQGNRTLISTSWRNALNTTKTQDLWYQYDSVNRVTLSEGALMGGTLSYNSLQGISISYNLAGRRQSINRYGPDMLQRVHNWNTANNSYDIDYYRYTNGFYTESYGYDGAGRVNTIYRNGELQETVDGRPLGLPTALAAAAVTTREFDNASRVKKEENWRVNTGTTVTVYDDDGRLKLQTTRVLGNITGPRVSEVSYNYDAANVLRDFTSSGYSTALNGTETLRYTSVYSNVYTAREGYLLQLQHLYTSGPQVSPLAGSVTRAYNVNGELISAKDAKQASNNRFFANNANGQAMTVLTGNYTDAQLPALFAQAVSAAMPSGARDFLFANGQQVGVIGLANPYDFSFDGKFDVNYTGAMEQLSPTAPPEVVTQEGDTLRTLAARHYGDGGLWYLIASENGLASPDAVLSPGMVLRMPNSVVSLANNSSTFKPFNPLDAVGQMSPTQEVLPLPPQARLCGPLAAIIVVIIVAILIYAIGPKIAALIAKFAPALGQGGTGAALAGAGSAVNAGSTAAVLGEVAATAIVSAAQQQVIVSLGYQNSISWSAVAADALTAGLTAGVSKAFGAVDGYAQTAALAAAKNFVGQGVRILLGVQEDFDWRGLAVAAISAPLSKFINEKLGDAFGDESGQLSRGGQLASDFLTGIATSTVSQLASGGKVSGMELALDAFGNVFGSAMARTEEVEQSDSTADEEMETVVITASRGVAPVENDPIEPWLSAIADASFPSMEQILNGGTKEVPYIGEIVVTATREQSDSESLPYLPSGSGSNGEIGAILYYSVDGTPVRATGRGTDIQGQMRKIDDATSGLYTVRSQQHGDEHAYVDDAGNKAWGHEEHGQMIYVRMTETEDNPNTMANNFDISEQYLEAQMAAGHTGAAYAAKYAIDKVGYELYNFVTLGFVKRHDARIQARADGYITDDAFWRATSIDGVGTAASAVVAGRAGNLVINRLGTGYAGFVGSSAAGGAVFDVGHQVTQMSIYTATDGQTGQADFSVSELMWATGTSAALGGVFKFGSSYDVRSPFTTSAQGGNPFGAGVTGLQSPVVSNVPKPVIPEVWGPESEFIELGSVEAAFAKKAYYDAFNSTEPLVIGRNFDTKAGAQLGMRALDEPYWTLHINDSWVMGGAAAGKPFYLGSNIGFNTLRSNSAQYPTTVFFRELKQLRELGYGKQGDHMLPGD